MVKYDFYRDTYLGSSITEAEWPQFRRMATDKLNHYKRIYTVKPQTASITFDGRGGMTLDADAIGVADDGKGNVTIQPITTAQDTCEAMAICAMADAYAFFVAAQNGAGAVASASIGSVSVSYGGGSVDVSPKAQERELYRCACTYLEIYRGVGGCR